MKAGLVHQVDAGYAAIRSARHPALRDTAARGRIEALGKEKRRPYNDECQTGTSIVTHRDHASVAKGVATVLRR